MAGEMATAAGNIHPSGIHSRSNLVILSLYCYFLFVYVMIENVPKNVSRQLKKYALLFHTVL